MELTIFETFRYFYSAYIRVIFGMLTYILNIIFFEITVFVQYYLPKNVYSRSPNNNKFYKIKKLNYSVSNVVKYFSSLLNVDFRL